MYRFQHASWLAFLILIPLLIGLFIWFLYWRKKSFQKFPSADAIKKQLINFVPLRATTQFVLLASCLIGIIFGIANLQKAGDTTEVERKGVDVMIALDVSKSMLATDITPNRLAKAKLFIERLSDRLVNDRIGLVVFAGRSYQQVPLTVDHGAFKLLLQSVNPGMIPIQGTALGSAIETSLNGFSKREKKYKAIVLISDGEDHEEGVMDKAKLAKEQSALIFTVGIGSPDGAALVDASTGQPKLDEQGNPVISKLNESILKEIAASSDGNYQLLSNIDKTVAQIENALGDMEQRSYGAVAFTQYDSYFQYFLGFALILFLIYLLLPSGKLAKNIRKQPVAHTLVFPISLSLLFTLLSATNLYAQSGKKSLQKGNELYMNGKYAEAAGQYQKALGKDTNLNTKAVYNLGNALYQAKQIPQARQAYEQAHKMSQQKNDLSQSAYNAGNTYMEEKKWAEAIDWYKKALRKNPSDGDAKYNLAYAQAMLKKDGGGGKNKDQNKDNQDKNEQNKDQNQQDKQDQKDQQDQNKPDPKEGDENKEQESPAQKPKISEQQAEQILKALQQEEKKLQEKKGKQKGVPVRLEKDW